MQFAWRRYRYDDIMDVHHFDGEANIEADNLKEAKSIVQRHNSHASTKVQWISNNTPRKFWSFITKYGNTLIYLMPAGNSKHIPHPYA